jgi:uncharacterized protein (TIGR03067 family)
MYARLCLAAAVLIAAAAFAPAPLPKRERGGRQALTLERIQGSWIVEKVERSSNKGYQRTGDPLTEVRIEGARWTFVNGGSPSTSLPLSVDGNKAPAWFDLGDVKSPQTSGIISLRGGELKVLYQWGRPRPGSFETPPEGYWCITFRRK